MTDFLALDEISVIHTLGPSGTNLEMAAYHWFSTRGRSADVRLHPSLEVSRARAVLRRARSPAGLRRLPRPALTGVREPRAARDGGQLHTAHVRHGLRGPHGDLGGNHRRVPPRAAVARAAGERRLRAHARLEQLAGGQGLRGRRSPTGASRPARQRPTTGWSSGGASAPSRWSTPCIRRAVSPERPGSPEPASSPERAGSRERTLWSHRNDAPRSAARSASRPALRLRGGRPGRCRRSPSASCQASRFPLTCPTSSARSTLDIFGDPAARAGWLERQHASRPFDALLTLYDAAGPFTAATAARPWACAASAQRSRGSAVTSTVSGRPCARPASTCLATGSSIRWLTLAAR